MVQQGLDRVSELRPSVYIRVQAGVLGNLASTVLFLCHLETMLVVMPSLKLPWKPWKISSGVCKARPGSGIHDLSPHFIG